MFFLCILCVSCASEFGELLLYIYVHCMLMMFLIGLLIPRLHDTTGCQTDLTKVECLYT